jgi:hypothetical protein
MKRANKENPSIHLVVKGIVKLKITAGTLYFNTL